MTLNFVHILLVAVSLALLLQIQRVSTTECGIVDYVRPVILGGSETKKGEWPFLAAIQIGSKYICGGTIIAVKHVLTAAHCILKKGSVIELLPHEVVVRLGAYNLTNTNETGVIHRNVSDIFIHPDWDAFEKRFDADIAILVLTKNITFNGNIQPVCMPSANSVPGSMVGTVVGYGFRKNNKIHAEIPRRVVVRAVSSSHCFRKDDAVRPYSSERTFCGGNGDGSPDQGDSGSGYFFTPGFSWAQYGLVALLRTNSTGHIFSDGFHVYTNLTMFKDWIIATVNQTGGVVGEAKISITMNCEYGYSKFMDTTETIYSCRLYDIEIEGNDFETYSFNGLHLHDRYEMDVEEIRFVNGTMSYFPSGFGLFFVNIKSLVVGETVPAAASLGTKVVRRSDLRNLRNLQDLSFFRNDIGTLHEDSLWDLPHLMSIEFSENKLKELFNETFSRNVMLATVDFHSNQLTFLPANLFRNNPLLFMVNFEKNLLRTIDEKIFELNARLQIVFFNTNRIETLPKHLFKHNLFLHTVYFENNSLSSLDEHLFETNANLQRVDFMYNRIESIPRAMFQRKRRLYIADFRNNGPNDFLKLH
ncbi:hypothetical protein HA402_011703 [Bradysia odoriphaga]|nr:hypothetical protein HA402_011703 [Bradysia odoriphaga]